MVEPIIKYLKKGSNILCPFDTKNSEFVILLKENGFNVRFSHLWQGKDFFDYSSDELKDIDYIISNPPFSIKKNVIERLFQIGKPFMMLLGLQVLNTQEIARLFIHKELQLLMFDKRVSFNGKSTTFASGYFCWNVLPSNLIVEPIDHTNTGLKFIPSRMYKDKLKKELNSLYGKGEE